MGRGDQVVEWLRQHYGEHLTTTQIHVGLGISYNSAARAVGYALRNPNVHLEARGSKNYYWYEDKEAVRRLLPKEGKGKAYCDKPGTYCDYRGDTHCYNCGRPKGWRSEVEQRSGTPKQRSLIIERTVTYRIEVPLGAQELTPGWSDVTHATPDLIINELRDAYREGTLSFSTVSTRAFAEVDLGKNA